MEALFGDLGLRPPDLTLDVGAGSQAEQTAAVLVGMEKCLGVRRPDVLFVYSAETSALAGALAAVKLGIPVAHVEAGLRTHDMGHPREINRVMVDRVSRWLYTGSADADQNLLAEGADPAAIQRVGSVVIDSLVRALPRADAEPALRNLGLLGGAGPRPFVLVTVHRTENLADEDRLTRLLDSLAEIAADIPVVFPAHPRARARMNDQQLRFSGVLVLEPVSYLQFIGLERHATVVVTDSSGVQDETSYLGVPCLTLRDHTDRPVTVHRGTNTIVGSDPRALRSHVDRVLGGGGKRGTIPAIWDGKAAVRLADHVTAVIDPRTAPGGAHYESLPAASDSVSREW
jgi:UDP-N-acetylglucosamine 2-epimerase (non-hydrolysing)